MKESFEELFTMKEIIINILKSKIGWLLVIANLSVFLFLIGEIRQTQKLSKPICEDGKVVKMALVGPSILFSIHTLLNVPALLASAGTSELIFREQKKDPCIEYNFENYPIVYVGELAMVIISESFQWILVGYLIEIIFGARKQQE